MNLSVLCLYEINKKFTSGSQKFLLFKGKAKRGCEYIMIFFRLILGEILPVRSAGYYFDVVTGRSVTGSIKHIC